MRTNIVKQKLRRGEASFGTWLSLGDLYATRVIARMGFDWLTLDIEHSAIDWSQAASIFAAVADAGCVPLARVPEGAHHYIKRVLDAGAWGIVVPMVDTVEQAKIAVDAAYYPPTGNRSVGGGMHSMNFGATAADYYAQANDNILVVLQTESPRGVENAEAIYSLPGVDAIFIGPNDLRFQMRTPDGTFPTAEQHEAMVQRVITTGKKVKCPTGIHAFDPADALRRAEQGMRFIAVGSDLRFLSQKAQEVLEVLKPQKEQKDIVKYEHMPVFLLATLDTKGPEAHFLRDRLIELGVEVELLDTSCGAQSGDRGQAVNAAAADAASRVTDAYSAGKVQGVIALGGSAGTTIGTAAMRTLPLGVPKLMISTLASGQVRPWVGDKDILMLNSVVDIAGLNRISRMVLSEAAAAMAGMVKSSASNPQSAIRNPQSDRPLIAATMFGVTTPCVQHARKILEDASYEVIVFHATGNGGQAMESLIREGLFAGVLDITTTELADEIVGGILSAGPSRLTAAAETGIPQVVSVGALDMVNFGPRETVPEKFANRKFHIHNATVTLMRTTSEENARLGEEIACKLAVSKGPAAILLPLAGLSAIDRSGQPFDDPTARASLFNSLRHHHGNTELIEIDSHINDESFSSAAASKLLELIAKESHAKAQRRKEP